MRKLFFLLLLPASLLAQREPVLKQIDLPHPYYYREMYLPQLTSGPIWVTWSPDSKSVIYSMAGSLWQQKIDSGEAVQLTDGPGYDYQPDWSHDGKYVVYTKYDHDALELWLLDLANGKSSQLTKDGAVNVEPRWSPDGKRIAYVSTAGTKHFHIFLMEMDGGSTKSIRQLTRENVSTLPRYYYSKFDHEISPAWSPDGKDIVFISNHGHIHGTGGIWRATVPETGMIDTSTNAKEVHYEETNWKARPEFSPDGKRIVYASYLGREWHQLWLMPSQGGDVFSLTYGIVPDPNAQLPTRSPSLLRTYQQRNDEVQRTSTGFDNINPRWSPDGSKIAFISNRTLGESQVNIGGTALWVVSASTGEQRLVSDGTNVKKKYVAQRATVNLSFSDDSGDPGAAARVTVQNSEGRYFGEQRSWMQADDSLDPKRDRSEVHYFTDQGAAVLQLPAGDYSLNVFRGIDHEPLHKDFRLKPSNIAQSITQGTPIEGGSFDLKPLKFNDNSRWLAGDLHVHMNYGGAYRDDPRRLLLQASAEGLGVVENLIVNKEQRFPDILQSSTMQALWPWYESNPLVVNGQEFHTSYWGHLGLLNIKHVIIPGYAGYPNTAAASLVPMDADVADMAHAQNKDALVGWVHPFDELPDPYKDAKLTNELPIDVALGKVDYYEVLGFSDHKSSAAIWYRLLNLGFRLPAGAGTDAMTNFASLRGPVGLNRVYVNVSPGPLKLDEWLRNLKAGKTFATNGPLLRFTLGSQPIGGEVKVAKAGEVPFTAALRSIVPVDKVEVVCDGAVAKTIFPADQRSAATQTKDSQGHAATTSLDVSGTVPIAKSGWCVLRAYSDHAEEPIMDIYPYGTTSPIYVTVAGEKPRSPEDAKFFSKWIERVREDASIHPDYNTPAEREHVLKVLDDAARVYAGMER